MPHPSFVSHDQPLQSYNTFGISAVADNFIHVTTQQELFDAIEWAKQEDLTPLILGGGSNVLFVQANYPLVIHNGLSGVTILSEDADHVSVRVGAGMVWHDFVLHCIANDWGGVENLSLIPGTVGAAPMQNIGAYGVEIKNVFRIADRTEHCSI